jgi:hypothetical protein
MKLNLSHVQPNEHKLELTRTLPPTNREISDKQFLMLCVPESSLTRTIQILRSTTLKTMLSDVKKKLGIEDIENYKVFLKDSNEPLNQSQTIASFHFPEKVCP